MSQQTQERDPESRAARSAGRRRGLSAALSVACHLLILLALLTAPAAAPKVFEPQPITVELIDEPALAPAPPAPTPTPKPARTPTPKRAPTPAKTAARTPARTRPAPAKPVARRILAKTAAAPDADPEAADEAAPAGSDPSLSDAQLAGAASAGAGSPGRPCDMAGRLQGVLRKDRLVQASVAGFAGKAIMVWDGDWVWMHGDVGRGLTAVRQAMAWEIAFAPEACRSQPMHGLVVFSVNGTQGPVRLAVGLNEWRWSDLLGLQSASRH